MNHDENKPEVQIWIEPELEARIVAWVAGEASAFESAELERLVGEKPELAIFKRRIEAVHGLVAVAARPDREPLRLAPERRAKLLQTLAAADGAGAAGPVSKKPGAPAVFPLHGSRQQRARPLRRTATIAAGLMLGLFFTTLIKYSTPKDTSYEVALPQMSRVEREQDEWSGRGDFDDRRKAKRSRVDEAARDAAEAMKREGSDKRRMPRGEAEARKRAEQEPSQRRIVFQSEMPSPSAPATYVGEPPAPPQAADLEKQQALSGANAARLPDGSLDRGAIVLSPFEVKGDRESYGSAAANSLAGSRIATDFKDQIAASSHDLSIALAGEGVSAEGAAAKDEAGPAEDKKAELDGRLASADAPGAVTWGLRSAPAKTGGDFAFGTGKKPTFSAPEVGGGVPAEPNPARPTGDGSPDSQSLDSSAVSGARQQMAQRPATQLPTQNEETNAISRVDGNKEAVATDAVELVKPSDSPVLTLQQAPPSPEQKLKGGIESDALQAMAKKQIARIAKPVAIVAEPDLTAEVSAAQQPVSTFSLHVSDVSFRLAQAALLRGELPEADRIRPEEFYNAFNYGDPSPAMAEKVACHIEQSAHPVLQQRNLVRIAMRVPAVGRGASQPLHLTVMLDTSGSMEREDRAATVHGALASLVSLLGPNDRLTVVGFARQPHLLIDQLPGNHAREALAALARTPAEGGTDLDAALKLASELALRHHDKAAQNRIVLLTDGAANLGNANPELLASSIEALRQQGVAFDACGVGLEGIDDTMLEALTRKGDGRYYVLNTPEAADTGFARQLAGAFRPAAENVKVQVRFNTARVGAYRLIGFEKHRLKEEDFRNDKVDAAELAADEAAVAVYQVETLPQGEGDLGEVYVRFRDASNGNMVERSWPMSYDPQVPPFDRAPATMQLAGVATLLAEKLRGGRLGDAIKLDELAPVVNALRGHYAHEPRVQDLVTMYEQLRRMKAE